MVYKSMYVDHSLRDFVCMQWCDVRPNERGFSKRTEGRDRLPRVWLMYAKCSPEIVEIVQMSFFMQCVVPPPSFSLSST